MGTSQDNCASKRNVKADVNIDIIFIELMIYNLISVHS